MNKYSEEDLDKIYRSIVYSIKKFTCMNFINEEEKKDYKKVLEEKINKILNKYPEVIAYTDTHNYYLGTVFIDYNFIQCAMVLIILTNEIVKRALIKPEKYHSHKVELIFNKLFNSYNENSIESKNYKAIYDMASSYNLREIHDIKFVEAIENFIMNKLEEFPEILENDKNNSLGFIFADHDYINCAIYVARKNKSKLNVKDSRGLTMVNYAHPVLINTLKRHGYTREVHSQLVAAEFLSIENIKPISEEKSDG